MKMIPRLFIILFLTVAFQAEAFVPILVPPQLQSDVSMIEDPTLSQVFYGTLEGFPHTYEIHATQPFLLFTHIQQPDIESSKNNVSGILIKLPEKRGRVTEVTRLKLKEDEWLTSYDPIGGDSYRDGPHYEAMLEAGNYRIEVHTPDNMEKYVFAIGTREEMTIGYFERLRRLMAVKIFFEKSPIRIIESPLVYVPLIILGLGGCYFWYRRRKKM